MLPFTVDFRDGVPVSDQLVLAVRKAILSGQLTKGDEFPSVRVLSQELRMSPTTAHKVVAQLKDEGYLASRPGIGMVITLPDIPSREERIKHLQPVCRELLREATELNLELKDVLEAVRRAGKEEETKR